MIYVSMTLPVDMSSVDRFKISLRAQPDRLWDTKRNFCIDSTAFISFVRPLGKVRSDNIRSTDDNGKTYANLTDCAASDFEVFDMNRSEDGMRKCSNHERGRTAGSSKSTPRRKLTKSQEFENMYKIAAARQPSPNRMDVKSSRLYDKRVIHLPMFKLNLKTYVREKQDIALVENARQSLKEMMNVSRKTTKQQQMHTTSNERPINADNVSYSKGQQIVRGLSDVTPRLSKQGNFDQSDGYRSVSALQRRTSVAETVDTDRMYIRFESVNAKSPEYSDGTSDVMTRESCTRQTKTEDIQSDSQEGSAWPSYNDIKRLRGEKVVKKQGSIPLENKGHHFVSSNPQEAVQNWVETHCEKPVLRYTSKQSRFKLEPIVVPSHTCEDCSMCSRIDDGFGGGTPCPPNSPSLDEALDQVASANETFVNETWNDGDVPNDNVQSHVQQGCHSVRFADKPLYITDNSNTNHYQGTHHNKVTYGHDSHLKVRHSGRSHHHPTVLAIPRVTVKILATKEQLQEATSKLNYMKNNTS